MDGGYYLKDPTKCPNGFQFEPPAPGLFGQVEIETFSDKYIIIISG